MFQASQSTDEGESHGWAVTPAMASCIPMRNPSPPELYIPPKLLPGDPVRNCVVGAVREYPWTL